MDRLIYAIGDIHGCYDLLKLAVDRIDRHAKRRPYHMIFLGDYIDRGPEVKKAVELLMKLDEAGRSTCLRGNHEEMIATYHETGAARDLEFWVTHGGRATLQSYGARHQGGHALSQFPSSHLQWLTSRPLFEEDEMHVYVHAGVEPSKALADQTSADLLWIRERFLRCGPDELAEKRHLVHGHTIMWDGKPDPAMPELLEHRTNLDTGAYATGVLSVAVFHPDRRGPVDWLPIV